MRRRPPRGDGDTMSDSMKSSRKVRRPMESRPASPEGAAPARVFLVRTPRCSGAPHWAGLTRNRRVLWRNEPRNQVIARVATAVRQRDVQTLRAWGIRLRGEELPRGPVGRKVAILVESTE